MIYVKQRFTDQQQDFFLWNSEKQRKTTNGETEMN